MYQLTFLCQIKEEAFSLASLMSTYFPHRDVMEHTIVTMALMNVAVIVLVSVLQVKVLSIVQPAHYLISVAVPIRTFNVYQVWVYSTYFIL